MTTNERIAGLLGWTKLRIEQSAHSDADDYLTGVAPEEQITRATPDWEHSDPDAVRDVLPELRKLRSNITIYIDTTGVRLVAYIDSTNDYGGTFTDSGSAKPALAAAICAAYLAVKARNEGQSSVIEGTGCRIHNP